MPKKVQKRLKTVKISLKQFKKLPKIVHSSLDAVKRDPEESKQLEADLKMFTSV